MAIKKYRWLQYAGFFLLIPSLLINIIFFAKIKKAENAKGIKVIGVVDGDTIVLEGKVKLRLRCLDAPELEFCGGKEAKEKLTSLVNGKRVVLKNQILGQRGRPMAFVFTNNVFVNEQMLKSGWARYHHDQGEEAKKLKKIADSAKKAQKGIFSPKCYQKENKENPQCNIKGNIDKNKYKDNKKYYFPGCPQYKFTIVEKDLGENWFCSEKEAQKAGFTKAKNCP